MGADSYSISELAAIRKHTHVHDCTIALTCFHAHHFEKYTVEPLHRHSLKLVFSEAIVKVVVTTTQRKADALTQPCMVPRVISVRQQ